VGEAGEPHLLADPDLLQRHLRRPPPPPPPPPIGGVSGRRTRCRCAWTGTCASSFAFCCGVGPPEWVRVADGCAAVLGLCCVFRWEAGPGTRCPAPDSGVGSRPRQRNLPVDLGERLDWMSHLGWVGTGRLSPFMPCIEFFLEGPVLNRKRQLYTWGSFISLLQKGFPSFGWFFVGTFNESVDIWRMSYR
jgi:hypothetical protein